MSVDDEYPTDWRGNPLYDDFRVRMDAAGWAWLRIKEVLMWRWARKIVRWLSDKLTKGERRGNA